MTTFEQRKCAECGELFHVKCGPGIFISHRVVCDNCRGKPDVLGYADIKVNSTFTGYTDLADNHPFFRNTGFVRKAMDRSLREFSEAVLRRVFAAKPSSKDLVDRKRLK